MLTRPTV